MRDELTVAESGRSRLFVTRGDSRAFPESNFFLVAAQLQIHQEH
jgi:hypothetical protein